MLIMYGSNHLAKLLMMSLTKQTFIMNMIHYHDDFSDDYKGILATLRLTTGGILVNLVKYGPGHQVAYQSCCAAYTSYNGN